MIAPLVQFKGFVKQVSRNNLTREANIVLDTAFPRFWPADTQSDDWQAQRQKIEEFGVDYIFSDVNPPRRLAGCLNFPRGRYYSLCYNSDGDDQNTLVNELNAYLDPIRGGLFMFGDMAIPEVVEAFSERFGVSARAGHYILGFAIGRPGAISPIIQKLKDQELTPEGLGDQCQERVSLAVTIPYVVEQCEIPKVLDLRLPDCQEFIVEEFFKKDTPFLDKSDRTGIDKFIHALPILMRSELGGGAHGQGQSGTLQALAAFVRDCGASALVFPSARSDVLCEIQDRRLSRWRGWSLVDYRAAPQPILTCCHDISSGWDMSFPKGATVRIAANNEYEGSFEVQGMAKWCRDRVGEMEAEFVGNEKEN